MTASLSDRPLGLAPPAPKRALKVVRPTAPNQLGRRVAAFGAAAAAAALMVGSYFLPWWTFILYAPQYPGGLRLHVWLTGVTGDVHEIDTLNHYIGMASLTKAAPLERSMAAYGIATIVALTFILLVAAGRRFRLAALAPAIGLPVVFLVDSFYWLHRFGHHLNPHAPLRLEPFTPQMFGNGVIGQFMTFAYPELGFAVAVLGAGIIGAAAMLKASVCEKCSKRFTCGAICPTALIVPPRGGEEARR